MKFFFNIPFFKIKNIIFLLVFALSVFSSYGVTVDKSTNYGKVIDAYNGAMGIIGIKNLGKGGYKFVKNLPSQTKQLLQENKGIKNLLSAKYLKWKALTANLDDISDTKRELITKQEKVWKSLGFAEKVADAGSIVKHVSVADFQMLKKVSTVVRSGGKRAVNNVKNLVNEGKALVINPIKDSPLAKKVDDYIQAFKNKQSKLQGELGEEISEILAKELDNGTVLNIKVNNSGHGFDAMQFENSVQNPVIIRAIESKPLNGTSVVLPGTKNGTQMSSQWKRAKIDEMLRSTDDEIRKMGNVSKLVMAIFITYNYLVFRVQNKFKNYFYMMLGTYAFKKSVLKRLKTLLLGIGVSKLVMFFFSLYL